MVQLNKFPSLSTITIFPRNRGDLLGLQEYRRIFSSFHYLSSALYALHPPFVVRSVHRPLDPLGFAGKKGIIIFWSLFFSSLFLLYPFGSYFKNQAADNTNTRNPIFLIGAKSETRKFNFPPLFVFNREYDDEFR